MSREFYVPCQPYAYPIRSRFLSSRLKSLVKWRGEGRKASRPSKGSAATSSVEDDASTSGLTPPDELPPVAADITTDDLVKHTINESAENNSTNETNDSRIESQENKLGVPHNLIESNLVSSSFDPGTSSFSTVDSVPSLNTGELSNDREVRTTTFDESTNRRNESDLSNVRTDGRGDDEVNPINGDESLTLPSALIEFQIQASSSLRSQIFDVVPILYMQNGNLSSSSNARSTTIEESSFASSSSGSSEYTTTSSSSSSNNAVIEILAAAMDDPGRRLDNDYARPYYDLNARQTCGSGASEGVVSVNGVVGGMDCMPLRPGPFHYLISEQAKSLVALQELQNEVGALLEFRDLVIETFPNLRHKMAVTAAASAATGASSASNGNASSVLITSGQGSHIPLPLSSQSPSSRRIGEWEPGKVRRRVAQSRENESASSSLPRSRSNSHSGGNKHSATVQDSGFSTETSSKDSASTAIPRPQSPSSRPTVLDDAEDELWNLLDVIHRKGVRLREEVESLQGRLESVAPEELDVPSDILDAVRKVTSRRRSSHLDDDGLVVDDDDEEDLLQLSDEGSQLALLQREKLQLLDKVAELEAETISSRARAQELQSELAALSDLKNGLEDRLRAGLEAAGDAGAAGILAPGAHRIQPIEPTAPTLQSPRANATGLNIRSKDSAFASVISGDVSSKAHKNRFRTRTIEKNVLANVSAAAAAASRSIEDVHGAAAAEASANERRAKLGALDSVLISPTRLPLHQQVKRSDVDARKIAAILRERSPLELQRHLITSTVHNQVLQTRLDEVEKSTETLSERLGKAHEENEDLRFQLAERNIELEGTLARMRLLELLQKRPTTETDADDESESPLANGHANHLHQNGLDVSTNGGSSSADSSQTNHANGSTEAQQQLKPSPRRRPSRIPLLGANKATAPKPPSAASTPTSTTAGSVVGHRRNDSRDSLKSLSTRSNNPSISSNGRLAANTAASKSQGRDSSRESLNKSSLSKPREPTSRSLPRNNSGRDSLGKSAINGSLLSRPRDSLESTHSGQQQQAPGTPPRRPPAPARRSQSQAARPGSGGPADNAADGSGKSMQSSNPPSSWFSSEVSLYPDSLNSTGNTNHHFNQDEDDDETSSRTGSTRVEFIIGSPTRKRLFQTPWSVPHYFDSIDTENMMMHESYEYPPDHGEALAECDSLECDERLESDS